MEAINVCEALMWAFGMASLHLWALLHLPLIFPHGKKSRRKVTHDTAKGMNTNMGLANTNSIESWVLFKIKLLDIDYIQ